MKNVILSIDKTVLESVVQSLKKPESKMELADLLSEIARSEEMVAEKRLVHAQEDDIYRPVEATNTKGGFVASFLVMNGRPPTDQEIWNAACRSGIERTVKALNLDAEPEDKTLGVKYVEERQLLLNIILERTNLYQDDALVLAEKILRIFKP